MFNTKENKKKVINSKHEHECSPFFENINYLKKKSAGKSK